MLKTAGEFNFRVLILLLFPFLTNLFFGLVVWGGKETTDADVWYRIGSTYVEGLAQGDLSVVFLLPDHGPLIYILMGILAKVLSFLGSTNHILAQRLFSAVLACLVSYLTYQLGRQLGGDKVGLLSWFLVYTSLVFIPYEYWLKGSGNMAEINGFRLVFTIMANLEVPYFQFAVAELLMLCMIELSIFYLVKMEENSEVVKPSIFFGLALLVKFSCLPILIITGFFWFLHREDMVWKALTNTARYLGGAVLIAIVFNPVFWSPASFLKFLEFFTSDFARNVSPLHWIILKNLVSSRQGLRQVYLAMYRMMSYPAALFIESWLFQLFVFTILAAFIKKKKLDTHSLLPFFWFCSTYLFFMFNEKTSQVEPYIIHLFLPMALFCSLIWMRLLGRRSTDEVDCN